MIKITIIRNFGDFLLRVKCKRCSKTNKSVIQKCNQNSTEKIGMPKVLSEFLIELFINI